MSDSFGENWTLCHFYIWPSLDGLKADFDNNILLIILRAFMVFLVLWAVLKIMCKMCFSLGVWK